MKAAIFLVLSATLARPALQDDGELSPVDADWARGISERLAQEAKGLDKPRIQIDCDPGKAVGLHVPEKLGLLLAPQKDLKEGETEGYGAEAGKPLGYLFLYRLGIVEGGKTVERDRLHRVEITNDEGKAFVIPTLLLSVRQVAQDDWRLYVFGKGEKPVLDTKFTPGSGTGDKPVAVQVKTVEGRKDTLVITLFDKYQASISLARLKE
ncbi:MAG TPA: hypothetical protein VEN81_08690 [Planctomycetota bacterium]|nr:hypothetical protein [Planctomycetota bacterium]